MDNFLHKLWKIAFYMILHDPELYLQFPSEPEFGLFTSKKHYCLDGFPKQGLPCVKIIGPPLWKGIPYMNIKSNVLIIEDS